MVPRSPTLKAVLLDAGGTLLVERRPREAMYADAARAFGIPIENEAMGLLMERTHRDLHPSPTSAFRYSIPWFQEFIGRIFRDQLGLDDSRCLAVEERLFRLFADPAQFELVPGASELLDGLRAEGLRLGIVSNWSPALGGLLEGLGLTPRVDRVWISAVEALEKPSAEIFLGAVEALGATPAEAVHLGDHPRNDFEGARAAGLQAVLLDRSGAHPGLAPRVSSLAAFLRWIAEERERRGAEA